MGGEDEHGHNNNNNRNPNPKGKTHLFVNGSGVAVLLMHGGELGLQLRHPALGLLPVLLQGGALLGQDEVVVVLQLAQLLPRQVQLLPRQLRLIAQLDHLVCQVLVRV